MEFTVDILAEADMLNAFDYYESKQEGLGKRFIDEVDEAFELIKQFPYGYPNKFMHYRQHGLPSFPYLVYYEIKDNSIKIISIYHTSRDRD